MAAALQRILLVGGGHSHVQVIKSFHARAAGVEVTLVDPQAEASYSGMVPGCVAGLYDQQDTKIKLGPLAQYADVTFKQRSVVDITLEPAKSVTLDDGEVVEFDVASFDIGSTTRGIEDVPGVKAHAIPTRPISDLVKRIELAERALGKDHAGALKVVVIGAGAAGIELAFAMRARWGKFFSGVASLDVTLCDSGAELLGHESEESRAATTESLGKRGVAVLHGCHVASVEEEVVVLEDGRSVPYTHCIWATGAASHPLAATLGTKGVRVNPSGWIEVNEQLQSVSEPSVFAAGDCCSILGKAVPKAGVFAVREGPILIENLARQLKGEVLATYEPQPDFLKLLMCGDGSAIGFRFGKALTGRWVWELKDFIDRGFMDLFDVQKIEAAGFAGMGASETGAVQVELGPEAAAKALRRSDDGVNYKENWQLLRRMMADDTFREAVLELM